MNNNKGVIFMSKKKGSLSINSENIFPIIKKWLYSDPVSYTHLSLDLTVEGFIDRISATSLLL